MKIATPLQRRIAKRIGIEINDLVNADSESSHMLRSILKGGLDGGYEGFIWDKDVVVFWRRHMNLFIKSLVEAADGIDRSVFGLIPCFLSENGMYDPPLNNMEFRLLFLLQRGEMPFPDDVSIEYGYSRVAHIVKCVCACELYNLSKRYEEE